MWEKTSYFVTVSIFKFAFTISTPAVGANMVIIFQMVTTPCGTGW